MIKNYTSSLAGAFILITFVNLLSRGLGFFREILFANFFGRGIEFDVYLVAAVIPITINTIIVFIGQNYFIPAYHKVKSNKPASTNKFFVVTLSTFILGGLIITLLLYMLSDVIVTTYITSNNESLKEIAVNIFRIFIFTIPLSFAISILSAFEQAEYKFKYPALARLFLNITIIPVLIIFSDMFGIYTIPVGFLLGTLFQLFYLLMKGSSKIELSLFSNLNKNELFSYLDITILSVILIEAIGQVYILSDRYFFSSVNQGGIASLNYATSIFNLPISVVSLALATVIFPKFSENIQTKSFGDLQNNLAESIRVSILLFMPIAFLFFFYGDVIIKLLFERGKFMTTDTLDTFLALKAYAVSLVFYSTYTIFNKILYSAKLVNWLLIITISGITLKVILNFIFVVNWKQHGLALATSCSYLFFFIASLIIIYKKLPLKNRSTFFKEFVFHLANGSFSYFIVEIGTDFEVFKHDYLLLIKLVLFVLIYLVNLILAGNSSLTLIKQLFTSTGILGARKQIQSNS